MSRFVSIKKKDISFQVFGWQTQSSIPQNRKNTALCSSLFCQCDPTSFRIPEVTFGADDRIWTQYKKIQKVLSMEPNSHLTEWWSGMRHRSETSLAGTGHLHRVNKGNPALHHHDSWYKPAHPTSQKPRIWLNLELHLKDCFLLLLAKPAFDWQQTGVS